MELSTELERLERCALDRGVPSSAFAEPADEVALDRLRAAVAPMSLPRDVETLYRWHNGCSVQWLDSYGLQPIDDAMAEREVDIQQLRAAPAWLVLSTPPGGGGDRILVSLEVPGTPYATGVWSMETHDAHVSRTHQDLAAAAAAAADMMIDAAPSVDFTNLTDMRLSDLPKSADAYRLARSPRAFQWPDPPQGTYLVRFAGPDWPPAWRTSMRLHKQAEAAES